MYLTKDESIVKIGGRNYVRVLAAQDFTVCGETIRKGTVGGLIPANRNLSETTRFWLGRDAIIQDTITTVSDSYITGASVISNSKIAQSTIRASTIKKSNIWNSITYHSELLGCAIDKSDLTNCAKLTNTKVKSSSLTHVSARGAFLKECDASDSKISGAELKQSKVKLVTVAGGSVIRSEARNAVFRLSNITFSEVTRSRITRANVEQSDINDCRIIPGTTKRIFIRRCDLSASIIRATLRHMDLHCAKYKEASDVIAVSHVGTELGTLLFYKDRESGKTAVRRGCFTGTLAKFKQCSSENHSKDMHDAYQDLVKAALKMQGVAKQHAHSDDL